VGVLLACLGGCATSPERPAAQTRFEYFHTPLPDDAWSRKIEGWQVRERAGREAGALVGPANVSGSGEPARAVAESGASDLRDKYASFRRDRKRQMAREVASWIQSEARHHYVPDGAIDHWATTRETLDRNGDDCDGLELLAYNLLRELGFPKREVYRAIVVRPADGQHHMVTLWFESPDDPWVIDPTGAMTSGMPRMSEVPGWQPLRVFDDEREFTPQNLASAR
jgi:hypothetical protein